jgi:hypothetical protein
VNLQRLERCLLVSSRCHFAAFAGARVGEPHRRPTQAVDGRAGIRRDVGSLPIHARTEHCQHHELRRVEAARVGWATTAVAGFVLIPWAVGLSLGGLYLRYAHLAVLQNILGRLSSAAAGLMIATGDQTTGAASRSPHRIALHPARLRRRDSSQSAAARRAAWIGAHQYCRPGHRTREGAMSSHSASVELAAHLAISFGGSRRFARMSITSSLRMVGLPTRS